MKPQKYSILLAIPSLLIPLQAASPRLDAVKPAIFQLEPNARFASTDLKRWEVFTRTGVQVGHSVAIRFLGIDAGMTMEGRGATGPKISILHGQDSTQWKRDCPSFEEIVYNGLYPGIDLVYRRKEGHLKGDFIVQPGVDPAQIRFRVDGAEVRVDGETLKIKSHNETIEERIPMVYEEGSGNQVKAHYQIYPNGSIGIEVTGHDRRNRLVIDPDLAFSSYLYSSSLDQVTATAFSTVENTLLAVGWTESGDLTGATASQFKGSIDGYFARLTISATGAAALNTVTLFGGPLGTTKAFAVGVFNAAGTNTGPNVAGTIVVGGYTTSAYLPIIAGLPNTKLKGTSDGVILKFAPNSSTPSLSTYVGGTGTDQISAVGIDSNTVYFGGTTSARDLPVPAGVAQTTFGGGTTDGFAGTLTSAPAFGYLTYLGGVGADSVMGLAVRNGELYLTGATDSFNFPTLNPLQPVIGGGQDAFVTKLTSTGQLSYSTFLGGSNGQTGSPEFGTAIAVSTAGGAVVAGVTSSINFPVVNAAQPTGNFTYGAPDAFLTKLSPTGNTMVFSTYWGGSSWDQANAVVVLPSGYIAIGGTTSSLDFPTQAQLGTSIGVKKPGASTYNGSKLSVGYDGFVSVFSSIGTLYWSTYLGGGGSDSVTTLATNLAGEVFIGGLTSSTDFPITNPLQGTVGITSTNYHGFLAKIGLPKPSYGLFRASSGQFFLINNSSFIVNSIIYPTAVADWSNVCPQGTSASDAIPLVGDWDNTGRQRLGLYRVSTKTWYLDINGDDLFTPGLNGDLEVDNLAIPGVSNLYPVVGDWDNTGTTRLGYYSGGLWYLDMNNDHQFKYADDKVVAWGFPGDIPVVGDWTNSGKQRIGVFHQGFWYLDLRGDTVSNQGITAIMGAITDYPVFADWDNSGIKRIGTYRYTGYPVGNWFADANNNYIYDPWDPYFVVGGTYDIPVTGLRSH